MNRADHAATPALRGRRRRTLLSVLLTGFVALWMVPIVGLLVTSFRPRSEATGSGWWTTLATPWRQPWTLANFSDAFASLDLGSNFLNSMAVAVPATLLPILLAAYAAYGFTFLSFRGREAGFAVIVGLLVVPIQIALIPILQAFISVQDLTGIRIVGSYPSAWLVHATFALPLAVFILRNYMSTLPTALIEAALVDGASHHQIFWRVVMPLSVPAVASFAIFQFMWVWNDYLVAYIFIGDRNPVLTQALFDLLGSVQPRLAGRGRWLVRHHGGAARGVLRTPAVLRRGSDRRVDQVNRSATHPPQWLVATGVRDALGTRLADAIESRTGFPAWAEADGAWHHSADGNWLGGFAVAAYWDRWDQADRHPSHRRILRQALAELAPLLEQPTAFNGFVFHYAAMRGAVLTHDLAATELAIRAAETLARLAHPETGVIPLGEPELDHGHPGLALTYVDPLGPLAALLSWAGRMSGDDDLTTIARNGTLWHLEALIRSDGSVAQAARFDRRTGAVHERFTAGQGYHPSSTWARSPAWALLGAALAAEWLPDTAAEILTLVDPVATWWISALPGGRVPPWDFDAPHDHPLDTSASAIACTALVRLAANPAASGRQRTAWHGHATSTFTTLSSMLTQRRQGAGLPHGCYHLHRDMGVDAETVWGDWYFYEAASLLLGGLPERGY